MKNTRALIIFGGLALIGISLAFILLVLPESYHNTGVGKVGMFHLLFAELALLASLGFMGSKDRNSADLPARLSLPMMLGFYVMIVAGVFLATPGLNQTMATAMHLILLAGLVMLVIATFIAGGHAKNVQDEDQAAQQGYDLMLLAVNSAERSLSENSNKADLGDVASLLSKLKETIEFSDRGGVSATAGIEEKIASGLRALSETLTGLNADGVDEASATIRSLKSSVAERNDLLKLKK
jgi:hypothetical protein